MTADALCTIGLHEEIWHADPGEYRCIHCGEFTGGDAVTYQPLHLSALPAVRPGEHRIGAAAIAAAGVVTLLELAAAAVVVWLIWRGLR